MPKATSLAQSGMESSDLILASSAAVRDAKRASAGIRIEEAIFVTRSTVDVASACSEDGLHFCVWSLLSSSDMYELQGQRRTCSYAWEGGLGSFGD